MANRIPAFWLRLAHEAKEHRGSALVIALGVGALVAVLTVAGNYQAGVAVMEGFLGQHWIHVAVFSPVFPLVCIVIIAVLLWRIGDKAAARMIRSDEVETSARQAAIDEVQVKLDGASARADARLEEIKEIAREASIVPHLIGECWMREKRLALLSANMLAVRDSIDDLERATRETQEGGTILLSKNAGDPLHDRQVAVLRLVESAALNASIAVPVTDLERADMITTPAPDMLRNHVFNPADNPTYFGVTRQNTLRIRESAKVLEAFMRDEANAIEGLQGQIAYRVTDARNA